MKDSTYILALIIFAMGVIMDSLSTISVAIFVVLQLIFFELKKLNDK
jgi:hypothetical protein